MRIAVIAPPWYSVPPSGYGGIEWVVALLADGLTERGHEVTLFAPPGFGPLGASVGGAGPGQQLILAHHHEPGPVSLEQQLGRVHHLLEDLGEALIDV